MERKRSRLEVIRDILLVIRNKNGRIKPTQILYKSNLSHLMMKDYLGDLMGKGFVTVKNTPEGKRYSITEKANKYLAEYGTISNFMDSFGLSNPEQPQY